MAFGFDHDADPCATFKKPPAAAGFVVFLSFPKLCTIGLKVSEAQDFREMFVLPAESSIVMDMTWISHGYHGMFFRVEISSESPCDALDHRRHRQSIFRSSRCILADHSVALHGQLLRTTSMGVSRRYPNSWMVYSGTSHLEMDDEQGYPYFRKPLSMYILLS